MGRKFGENWSKTLPVGLFFHPKFPGWGHNSMPEYTAPLNYSKIFLLSPSVEWVLYSVLKSFFLNGELNSLRLFLTCYFPSPPPPPPPNKCLGAYHLLQSQEYVLF